MLSLITPHIRVEHVLEIGPRLVRSLDLDGLLLDVDNTLKDHDAAEFHDEIVAWSRSLRQAGTRLCLLSNGRPRRIARLAFHLGVPYVARAFKPLPFGCRAGLRALDVAPGRAAVVGDQLFADVLAGRLGGLRTILVTPTSSVEPWFTRLKRPLESRVLRRLEAGGHRVLGRRRDEASPVDPDPLPW